MQHGRAVEEEAAVIRACGCKSSVKRGRIIMNGRPLRLLASAACPMFLFTAVFLILIRCHYLLAFSFPLLPLLYNAFVPLAYSPPDIMASRVLSTDLSASISLRFPCSSPPRARPSFSLSCWPTWVTRAGGDGRRFGRRTPSLCPFHHDEFYLQFTAHHNRLKSKATIDFALFLVHHDIFKISWFCQKFGLHVMPLICRDLS